ncbi:MAG: glycerate kinase [Chloroflexota bacterium]
MKIIVAPGAFKNSLRATDAADAITHGLARSGLDAEIVQLPIADGGNGTLDVMLAASSDGERHTVMVRDPIGRPVRANYGLMDSGRTAVIEMALASGLELISGAELNPMRTSTYGTGELLKHALDAGATRFIVGLGGSATVDGGSGALMALGARYFDANDRPIVQRGGSILNKVARIDMSNVDSRWPDCEILVAVDVDNPPYGERGAAAVFGPQKGATEDDIPKLEAGLKQFFVALTEATTVDVTTLEGGGAAGALSAGLYAGLGAELVSGSDLILKHVGFDAHLVGADLVITGEGRMDEQTVGGKGPFGVALRARQRGIPTVALVGGLAVDDGVLHDAGIDVVLPIVDKPMPLEIALLDAQPLLERAALRLGYTIQIGRKLRIP